MNERGMWTKTRACISITIGRKKEARHAHIRKFRQIHTCTGKMHVELELKGEGRKRRGGRTLRDGQWSQPLLSSILSVFIIIICSSIFLRTIDQRKDPRPADYWRSQRSKDKRKTMDGRC